MKSSAIHFQIGWKRSAGIVFLALALSGCGAQIVSYNPRFRAQGIDQYNQASYADAAGSFQNAIREEPGDYVSRYYLGQCYEKMDKLQEAIEEYRTTLNVMSHSLEGREDSETRRKVVDSLAGTVAREPDKSGDLAAMEREAKTPEQVFLLAKIYRQIGDADLAITRFDQAQRLDPNDPQIAKEYGLYLEQLGQTQIASTQLRRAYTLNSKDEEVSAALRRLGIVPGPSLKAERDLEKPVLPLGPLPEVDLSTSSRTSPANSSPPPQPGTPTPGGPVSSSSPRD